MKISPSVFFFMNRLCHNSQKPASVILTVRLCSPSLSEVEGSEAKNLVVAISCKTEILRLTPQNDTMTHLEMERRR